MSNETFNRWLDQQIEIARNKVEPWSYGHGYLAALLEVREKMADLIIRTPMSQRL